MIEPVTIQGIRMLFDSLCQDTDDRPNYIVISEVAYRAIKASKKAFGRRDKRRKHKRYA